MYFRRTLEEEEEEEALEIAREAEEKEAQIARYLASMSEDESSHSPMKIETKTPAPSKVPTLSLPPKPPTKFEPLSPRDRYLLFFSSSVMIPFLSDDYSSPHTTPRQVTATLLSKYSPNFFSFLISIRSEARPSHVLGSSDSPSSSPGAIVTKDRRVTSPSVVLGSDSYVDGEDYINKILSESSDKETPRPVSAYVDLKRSYDQPGSRDSNDMTHEDNPMQSQTKIRRDKASTVHTSTPSQQHPHPVRRPSPTDMKNLDDFKKGRSSKRATGKTQV